MLGRIVAAAVFAFIVLKVDEIYGLRFVLGALAFLFAYAALSLSGELRQHLDLLFRSNTNLIHRLSDLESADFYNRQRSRIF